MATEASVTGVRTVVEQMTKDPIERLVTNLDWGRINFQQAQKNLEMIFAICLQLKNLPIELMPEADIGQIKSPLDAAAAQIAAMRSFTIEQSNATGVRDGIVSNLQSYTDQLYTQTQIRIPFLAFQRGDIRQNEAALNQAVNDAKALLESTRTDSAAKQSEINDIVTAAREAAASVGVAHFSDKFEGTANSLDSSAKNWLRATGIFGLATLAAALAFPYLLPLSAGAGAALAPHDFQVLTSKLVVLGILFTATVWCGRVYKATKHQVTTNRHRGDALRTFQAFVKASSDDQTRNAVLLETTRSIFSSTSTGYLDGVEKGEGGPLQVLEIVKSATESSTKT